MVLMTIYRRGWTVYGDSSDGIVYKISKRYSIVKVKGQYGRPASIGHGRVLAYQMESRSGNASAFHFIVLGLGQ